jgi:putative intracellular protease/amidase
MLRGLEGRRLALFIAADSDVAERRADIVIRALEGAGARIHVLSGADRTDDEFRGGQYAALVLIGDGSSGFSADPRLVQLTREALASDKPVAALDGALSMIMESGGAAGRTLAAHGPLTASLEAVGAKCVDEPVHVDDLLISAQGNADVETFAAVVVRELSNKLEERDVDEMSDLSFPASDPPAVTPSTIGGATPDLDARA